MKVFYRRDKWVMTGGGRAQKLLLLHKNHQLSPPVLWLPSYHGAEIYFPEDKSTPVLSREHSFLGSQYSDWAVHTQLISREGQTLAKCFRRLGSMNGNDTTYFKMHPKTLIWAMKRWTLCGNANMAKCSLKNLGDEFSVPYTIPSTFCFQIFITSIGENVNDKK